MNETIDSNTTLPIDILEGYVRLDKDKLKAVYKDCFSSYSGRIVLSHLLASNEYFIQGNSDSTTTQYFNSGKKLVLSNIISKLGR